MDRIVWARTLAGQLLADALPQRWAHTQGVGRKAESIAEPFGADAELLVSAAWLHDIGYSPDLAATGFHPLDGARYLRDVAAAGDRLCSFVAYHSCAEIEARHRGFGHLLSAEFKPVTGLLPDALTFCDMTTTPDGRPTDVDARLAEIQGRYGEDHPVARSMREAGPYIIRAADQVAKFVGARRRLTSLS
jgi:HD domain